MSDPLAPRKPRLHTLGTIYVTLTAAERYLDARPWLSGVEESRRQLTERMLDAHMVDGRRARYRDTRTGEDLSAIISHEGRLLVITHVESPRRPRREGA